MAETNRFTFVFAAWVSNKKLSTEFIAEFNKVLRDGLLQLDTSVEKSAQNMISKEVLKEYLTTYIDFDFNQQKREAMNLFLSKLN